MCGLFQFQYQIGSVHDRKCHFFFGAFHFFYVYAFFKEGTEDFFTPDLVLKLKKTAHDPSLVYFREMTLKPHTQHTISVKFENGIKGGDCNFEVTNFIVAPDKGLDYTIKL